MALPRPWRVRRSSEHSAVRASGKSWRGQHLLLATLLAPDRIKSAAACTLTRRIGNAVTRNHIRRRLQGILTELLPTVTVPHRLILVPRASAGSAPYAELRAECWRLAVRAGLVAKGTPPPPPSAP